MKLVRHPNVVRLHAVFASRTKIYIILEFITGGELFDKIVHHVRLSEAESRRFFQQLIDGVEYCHSKGPENILLDSQGNLKISDFGLSALPAEGVSNLQTTCGTLNYVAPELITGSEAQGLQWCFGGCMVMWGHLICTDGKDTSHLVKCFSPHCIIRSRKLNFHAHHFSPVGAKSLIHRILDPNPETRICIEEIRNDEWFKKNYVPARVVEYEDVNLDYVNAVFDDSEEERGDEQEIDEDAGHAL